MPELAGSSNYILLAEDNPADIQLVRVALEDRAIDCDLFVVSDGERAVEWIEGIDRDPNLNCPKIILMDLHLPKVDGDEILACLRASEKCGSTPVVVMTSSDSPGDRAIASRHSAMHYFRKPSTLDQFLTIGDIVKDIIGFDTRQ